MGLNAKESAERMGSVCTSYLLSVIGEKGRNVPDLGVLHVYIYIHTHTRTLLRGHWKLGLIREQLPLQFSLGSSDALHLNATVFHPRKQMFYGRINGRNFAASPLLVALASHIADAVSF